MVDATMTEVDAFTDRRKVIDRAALSQALEAVQRAGELRRSAAPAELVAEELRLALAPLGELVGELTPEDLLDQIFGRFCLGK